jgi:hypothetical protein
MYFSQSRYLWNVASRSLKPVAVTQCHSTEGERKRVLHLHLHLDTCCCFVYYAKQKAELTDTFDEKAAAANWLRSRRAMMSHNIKLNFD